VKWLSLGLVAVIAAGFLYLSTRERYRSAAKSRLDMHTGHGLERKGLDKRLRTALKAIESSRRVHSVKEAFESSGLEAEWPYFRLVWLMSAISVPAVAVLITGSPLWIPPAILIAMSLPIPALRAIRRRNERKVREQCDALAFDLALQLKCGIPIDEAFVLCVDDLHPPISLRIRKHLGAELISLDTCEKLLDVARTLENRDLELIARSAAASRQTGSDIRAVMDNVADAVRDRIAIRRELEAETVQGALSGKLVAALPFIFLGISALISRQTISVLLGTIQGLLMLSAATVLDLLGFLWVRKILDFEK